MFDSVEEAEAECWEYHREAEVDKTQATDAGDDVNADENDLFKEDSGRKLTAEPKFVQKRRQLADSKDTYEDVSTFEKEIPEKSWKMSTFVKRYAVKTLPLSTLGNNTV